MTRWQVFEIVFSPEVVIHLRFIERKYQSMIRKTIHEQLRHSPNIATRNRKPLNDPVLFDATWELRFGPNNRFRIFYDVDENEKKVSILAIGVKTGNRLTIGSEEFEP